MRGDPSGTTLAVVSAGLYLCRIVITRRLISLALGLSLLASLLAPNSAESRTCGEAARAITATDAPAAKPHGCKGCSKAGRSKDRPVVARVQAMPRVGAAIPLATLCCRDAATPRRAAVDVPTLGGSVPAAPMMLAIAIEGWLSAESLASVPILASFKIGPSPPYLAALHRHTYLCTSTLLI